MFSCRLPYSLAPALAPIFHGMQLAHDLEAFPCGKLHRDERALTLKDADASRPPGLDVYEMSKAAKVS